VGSGVQELSNKLAHGLVNWVWLSVTDAASWVSSTLPRFSKLLKGVCEKLRNSLGEGSSTNKSSSTNQGSSTTKGSSTKVWVTKGEGISKKSECESE